MPRGRPSTIHDVARAAGVSVATVSRVLNRSRPVDATLAARVEASAARLGYRPSGAARALRRQATNMLAVLVADIENPFFTALVRGVEDVALTTGHSVVLCNTDEDPTRQLVYMEMAVVERVAGVVIAVTAGEPDVTPLVDAGIPVVAVDRVPADLDLDAVVVDNHRGGRLAADHLVEAGCRRLACVTGPRRTSTATERAAGFVEAARAHGCEVSVRHGDFREAGGWRITAALLRAPKPPDGLFVGNNLMTVGALGAIRAHGAVVPEELKLVGFDDFPAAALVEPPLTVVAQPARQIGRCAAQLLQRRTRARTHAAERVVLEPELVIRASTGVK